MTLKVYMKARTLPQRRVALHSSDHRRAGTTSGSDGVRPDGRAVVHSRCRYAAGNEGGTHMKTRFSVAVVLALALTLLGARLIVATQAGAARSAPPPRPAGPCDVYAAA